MRSVNCRHAVLGADGRSVRVFPRLSAVARVVAVEGGGALVLAEDGGAERGDVLRALGSGDDAAAAMEDAARRMRRRVRVKGSAR